MKKEMKGGYAAHRKNNTKGSSVVHEGEAGAKCKDAIHFNRKRRPGRGKRGNTAP